MTRRGRTRVRIRPVSSDSTRLAGNDQQSPTTPPILNVSPQPLLQSAKEQSRKKNLKEKYHLDDLELKNTLGMFFLQGLEIQYKDINRIIVYSGYPAVHRRVRLSQPPHFITS